MHIDFNESPLSNVDGKKDFKEMSKNFIEVMPSLPTYHIEDVEVTRVLKYLFEADSERPKKMIVEYSMGFCRQIDYDIDCFDFSCLPFAPDTMPAHEVFELFIKSCFDLEFIEQQLMIWGIKKVYMEPNFEKIASVHNLLDGLDRALSEGTLSNTMVKCDDGENIALGVNLFECYKTDKLIELYKETKDNKIRLS